MKRRNFMRFFAAKDHGLQTPGNPLFPHKEKPSRRLWVLIALIVLATFLIAAGIAVVFGPWLRIREVVVTGAVTLPVEDIRVPAEQILTGRRFLILPANHRWFVKKHDMGTRLQQTLPLKSASVTTQGSQLQIDVVEDVFLIAFQSGDVMWFLDRSGVVLREATPEEKAVLLIRLGEAEASPDIALPPLNPVMPIIKDKSAAPRVAGDGVYTAEIITNLVVFDEGLRGLMVRPKLYETEDPEEPWFTVRSDKPFAILFDAAQPPRQQLAILKTVFDEYFATEQEVRYVDIRFGQRVYIR